MLVGCSFVYVIDVVTRLRDQRVEDSRVGIV